MEEVEKLYSVLTEGGYYTKSFEEFQEQFKDPSYQERVYGVVERDNLFGEKKNDVPDDVTDSASEDGSSESAAFNENDLSVLNQNFVTPSETPGEYQMPEVIKEQVEVDVPQTGTEYENTLATLFAEKEKASELTDYLKSKGVNVKDMLLRIKSDGISSTGTEEEDIKRIYSTYVTDAASKDIITDVTASTGKPKFREGEFTSLPDLEDNVYEELDIDKTDFATWDANTQRQETGSFRFIKSILPTEENEKFLEEKRKVEKIVSYKMELLNNIESDINSVDAKIRLTTDYQSKRKLFSIRNELLAKFDKEAESLDKIKDLYPEYEKQTNKLDLKKRKKLYEVGQKGGSTRFFTELGDAATKIPTTISRFALGAAASIFSLSDQVLTGLGYDKKGILAGVSESILDTADNVSRTFDSAQRPSFLEGKKVTFNGKEYIVTTDGQVVDEKTRVRMDGIISEEEIKNIKNRAKSVKFNETFWNGGAIVQNFTQTVSNLFALIRGGGRIAKALGVSGRTGIGIASYASTVAENVEDMRSSLVKAGVNEKEALGLAARAGNAIATLDGLFTSLAGDNQKLLTGVQGIKKSIISLVKKDGKKFSQEQLKSKIKDLVVENLREVGLEELPVLFSEKAINAVVNSITGLPVRDSELRPTEIYETILLTLGATSGLGAPTLIKGSKRNDVVRYAAANIENLRGTIDKLVLNQELTPEQGERAYNEIYTMQTAINRTKGTIVNSDNMVEMSDLLFQRQNLLDKRKDLEGPLKEEIDKEIADVDRQIKIVKERDKKQADKETETPPVEVTRKEAEKALDEENEVRSKAGLPVIIASEENITKKQNELIKERTNAIQESSAKEIPVQEQPPTSTTVREGDTTRRGVTRKGTPKKDTAQPGKEGEVETQVPPSEVEQERNRLRRQVRNPKTRGLDRRTALVNYINTVKTKGKIAARTARSLIKQANLLNLNNPVTVDRFLNRVDKSFQKAESTAQIQKAERLRKQIQKKSKSKTIDGRVTVAAKEFGRVDPLDVDDIDVYIQKAEQLLQGMQPTKRTRAGLKIAPAADIAATEKYSSEQIQKQEQRQEQVQREAFELATDIPSKDLSLKEIREILEDPTSNNSKKKLEEKEKTTRAGIKKAFNTFSAIVKKQLETGRDAFDADSDSPGKIKYTKEEKRIVNAFMKLNIDNMSTQEAMRALDSLINFTTNGRTGGMLGVVKTQEGVENAKKSPIALKRNIKNKAREILAEVFDFGLKNVASLGIKTELIFGTQKRGAKFMKLSGITDMIRGFDTAEAKGREIIKNYYKVFENKKANNQVFNSEENNIERGMLARVRRTVDGTETEQDTEFRREKKLIEDSITELKNSTKSEEKKLGEVYEKVYNRILKGSNNPSEVESKTDKTNLEAVEWFTKEWGKHYKKLSDISLDIYNKPLDKDLNYTHFSYSRLDSPSEETDLSSPMYTVETSSVYDKESGVLRKRTKPGRLPKNKYVNLMFDSTQSTGLRKALSDIETAPSIQQVNGFINSPSMDKIIPDQKRRKIMVDALTDYVNSKRGNQYYEVENPYFEKITNALAKFAVSRTLASLGQYAKQLAPIASTMVTAGGGRTFKAINLFRTNKDVREWLKKSGYGIANRGISAEAVTDIADDTEIAPTSTIGKAGKILSDLQDKPLKVLLVGADKVAANTSWLAFYDKEMQKQGVDIFAPGFDWSTHKINKKAADYAQRQVDRQQNVSDRELQGEFFRSKTQRGRFFARIALPFASFQMNQKARMLSDLNTLFGGTGATAEERKVAKESLGGIAAEQAFFHTLGLLFTQIVASFALGEDEKSEEQKDKEFMTRLKGRATSIFTDVFSPAPFLDFALTETANAAVNLFTDEKTQLFFVNQPLEDFGVLGIPLDKAIQIKELATIAATGELETETTFGKTRTKKFTAKQRRNASITLAAELLYYSGGYVPAEVGQWTRYNLQNLKKSKSKRKKKSSSPFK